MRAIDPEKPYGSDLRKIAENQPQYNTLPARLTEDGEIYTCWEFSADERKLIAEGKPLHLRILTFKGPLQPFAMAIEGTPEFDVFYE